MRVEKTFQWQAMGIWPISPTNI